MLHIYLLEERERLGSKDPFVIVAQRCSATARPFCQCCWYFFFCRDIISVCKLFISSFAVIACVFLCTVHQNKLSDFEVGVQRSEAALGVETSLV